MARLNNQWNGLIRHEVARALEVLSATERYVLKTRFQLDSIGVDTVVVLGRQAEREAERQALRKLRGAALQRSLEWDDRGVAYPTFSFDRTEWPDSTVQRLASEPGGDGADWWDEA